jgi:hypothetical protein
MAPHQLQHVRQLARVLDDLVQDGGPVYIEQHPAAHARLQLIAQLADEGRTAIPSVDGDDAWPVFVARSKLVAIGVLADIASRGELPDDDPAGAVHVLVHDFRAWADARER